MKNAQKIVLLSMAALVLGSSGLSAQDWGHSKKFNRPSIILFSEKYLYGEQKNVSFDIPDLSKTGFNDNARSLIAYGKWEACTDAYFQGRCEVFEGEYPQLGELHKKISSLRFVSGYAPNPPYNGGHHGGGYNGRMVRGANTYFYPGRIEGYQNSQNGAENFCENQGHREAVYYGGRYSSSQNRLEDVLCK